MKKLACYSLLLMLSPSKRLFTTIMLALLFFMQFLANFAKVLPLTHPWTHFQSVLFNFNTCFKNWKYCPRLGKLDAEPEIVLNRMKNFNREHFITETFSNNRKIQKTVSLAVCNLLTNLFLLNSKLFCWLWRKLCI